MRGCWKTIPVLRRTQSKVSVVTGSLRSIVRSSIVYLPLSGCSSKFSERNNVDFPDPDGPTITVVSCGLKVTLMSFNA